MISTIYNAALATVQTATERLYLMTCYHTTILPFIFYPLSSFHQLSHIPRTLFLPSYDRRFAIVSVKTVNVAIAGVKTVCAVGKKEKEG